MFACTHLSTPTTTSTWLGFGIQACLTFGCCLYPPVTIPQKCVCVGIVTATFITGLVSDIEVGRVLLPWCCVHSWCLALGAVATHPPGLSIENVIPRYQEIPDFTRDIFLGPFEIIFCAVYYCDVLPVDDHPSTSFWNAAHSVTWTLSMSGLEVQPVSYDVKHAFVFQQHGCDGDISILTRWRICKIMNMSDAWEMFFRRVWSVEVWQRRSLHCVLYRLQWRRMIDTLELPRCLHPERSSCNALQLDVVWLSFCCSKRTGFLHHGLKRDFLQNPFSQYTSPR